MKNESRKTMIEKNIRFEKQGDLYKLFYDNGSKHPT